MIDVRAVKSIELVYYDIHARGELIRLLYVAAGRFSELKDTRAPFFMDNTEASRIWERDVTPKNPFRGLPFITITEEAPNKTDGSTTTRHLGAVESPIFAAQYLNLMGSTEASHETCKTLCVKAQSLLGPELTRVGHTPGQDHLMRRLIDPNGGTMYGSTMASLEKYVKPLRENGEGDKDRPYLLDNRLTLADISLFNCLDEFINGPRGRAPQEGVEALARKYYPNMMKSFDVVSRDLADHIRARQGYFVTLNEKKDEL